MEMIVHLHPKVFEIVKQGTKTVEVRVNDEKRRKLHVGDTLVFLKRPLEDEKIIKKVKKLEYYSNLQELVEHYDMKQIYLEQYTKEMYLQEMEQFYTQEEQDKYGVVAITFE